MVALRECAAVARAGPTSRAMTARSRRAREAQWRSGSTRSRSCARWTDAPPPEDGATDTDGRMFLGGMVALRECAAAARAGPTS